MSIGWTILTKSLVKPFYKQNAGLFAFLIFIMVAAVGRANGVGLLEYHYSLIQGIMTDFPFLLFTLSAWILYALKCAQFMSDTLAKRDYVFLSLLTLEKKSRIHQMMFGVQVMLLFPVLLYASIAVWIGLIHSWWLHVIIVVLFFLLLSFAGSWWYRLMLGRPGKTLLPVFRNIHPFSTYSFYWIFQVRYIWNSRKILFLVIKSVNCLVLYGLFLTPSGDNSDLRMVVLFYSFALLGHGVLIYIIRGAEEASLGFYRSLPVSLFQRFMQYAVLYFLLFIPEILVLLWLTPAHITYSDALLFGLFGYSTLLFLNSLLFIRFFKKTDYLKIVSGLFLVIFIAVLTGIFPVFCIGLFILSLYIFFLNYYRFEKIELV